MPSFTPAELILRKNVFDSQPKFTKFLNGDIINKLLYLFNETHDIFINRRQKIINYIKEERKLKGLNDNNVDITSEYYGHYNNNSTLFLKLIKNNKEFLHLTIHVAADTLDADKSGIIHILKDVYKNKLSREKRYALIKVDNPINKPNSLEFSIGYGWDTPVISSISNFKDIEKELQQEMTVIINVLNKLFDEYNSDFYIGNKVDTKMYPIMNNAQNFINNVNTRYTFGKRSNYKINIIPIRKEPVVVNNSQIPVITNNINGLINVTNEANISTTNNPIIQNNRKHISHMKKSNKTIRKKANQTTRKKQKK